MLIGGIIVSVVSFLASFFWARFRYGPLAVFSAIVFPIVISRVIFSFQLMEPLMVKEQINWTWAVIVLWLMYALPISIATTLLVRRSRAKNKK